jgi:D-glycero-D-manno-heptose 1,7-bisphosphate phosphatase
MRKLILLDRDGTLIEDKKYLNDPDGIAFFPDTVPALKTWAGAGYEFVIVTNQSGVATGVVTDDNLREIHRRLYAAWADEGLALLEILHAPYLATSEHYYRKPRPGMLREAMLCFDGDPRRSWMIGDTEADVAAGVAAGLKTIHLRRDGGPLARLTDRVWRAPDLVASCRLMLEQDAEVST